VRDTLQHILGSRKSDRSLSAYGKVVTIIVGAVGVAFALEEVRFIFWFILFAWSGLGAAFGPVLLCMLYDRRTTRAGVAAGMLGGFITCVVWVLAFKGDSYDLYEMIPGFFAGLFLTVAVSRLPPAEARAPVPSER
jgi:sodium/proline symporter